MKTRVAALVIALSMVAGASASIVQVQVNGTVEYNQIKTGVLSKTAVPANSPTQITFLLDSTQFMNDPNGLPTRGYFLNPAAFSAKFNNTVVGLENPYTAGTPMFVLRNNDPAVDGFFLSNGTAYDVPVNMNVQGFFGAFGRHFKVTYLGNTLSSLDITSAVGHYDYTGLTSFYDSVDDGGNDAMGIAFSSMDITLVPAPGMLSIAGAMGLAALRRRR